MSALTLTLADTAAGALDLGSLTPATLRGLKPTALRRLRIPAGNRQAALGDLFEISGDDPRTLRLHGLHGGCHRVGHGMREGRIEVKGSVGDELGREMRGGEIRVSGHAGAAPAWACWVVICTSTALPVTHWAVSPPVLHAA